MDSPLMPTLRNAPRTSSPGLPAMLADVTLSDEFDALDDSIMDVPDLASVRPPSFPAGGQSSSSSSSSTGTRPQARFDTASLAPSSGRSGQADQGRARPRHSLFTAPNPSNPVQRGLAGGSLASSATREEDDHHEEDEEEDDNATARYAPLDDPQARPAPSSAERDDKLRESLYELRKMNEVFEGFLSALEAARGHNQRLAQRVDETSDLLDKYTALLGQSLHTQTLLSNPLWTGAEDDARAIEAEEEARIAAEEERQRVAEEKAAAAEARKREQAEAEDRARAAQASAAAGGGRGGARGRGGPGLARGAARGRGGSSIPPPSSRTVGAGASRGAAAGGAGRTVKRVVSSGNLASKYDHVQSSGYGPPPRR